MTQDPSWVPFESIGGFVKSWTKGVQVEDEAKQQLLRTSRLPFVYKWVAAMPDVHAGKGATVGSVIATRGAVMPAAVGVDLGCGMRAHRISKKKSELGELSKLRLEIEKVVPFGRTDNGGANDRGAWGSIPEHVHFAWVGFLESEYEKLVSVHYQLGKANAERHLATGGTGNHFLELSEDECGNVWIVIHSGSRGVGGKIGSYFTELAKKECEKWFVQLEDTELAYFPEGTKFFDDYIKATRWANNFASMNRRLMLDAVRGVVGDTNEVYELDDNSFDCHHNYLEKENHMGSNVWVTRKGACRARVGDNVIIPGSMGAKSYICKGLGNVESFMSCSHGAGRTMSRTKAKNTFTVEQHVAATEGIECCKDESVLDETPACYKDIDAVMEAQKTLVKQVHVLKQFLCVKGHDKDERKGKK